MVKFSLVLSGRALAVTTLLAGFLGACVGARHSSPDRPECSEVEDIRRSSPLLGLTNNIRAPMLASPGVTTFVMQTSVRRLRNPHTKQVVKLVSIHHIGTEQYFRGLEDELQGCDVVLTEGYNPDGFTPAEAHPALVWIYRWQVAVSSYLGLMRDKAWKDAAANERWKQVDVSLRSISEMATVQGWVVSEAYREQVTAVESWTQEREDENVRNARMATLYAYLFDHSKFTELGVSADRARDDVIFQGLKDVLGSGVHSVGMIYGALHAYALEPRICRELGFECVETSWHEVMRYEVRATS